jgi:hypothetical protein
MNEKYIELLKRQLQELDKIGTNPATVSEWSFGVEAWKSSTIAILERIFGQESRKIKEIERIELRRSVSLKGPDSYHIATVKETGHAILSACIAEIETLGSPNQIYNGEKQGINLTVLQSQENKQTIKLDIIVNELRKELTGSQLDEIQQILDSKDKPAEKKNKTVEKLKEFGINTLSNIIAGILTNPSIYA